MKKFILIIGLLAVLILSGCNNGTEREISSSLSSDAVSNIEISSDEVTNPQIIGFITPYMDNATWQDITTEETFKANLGMDINLFSEASLYNGMENDNTTYFFMADLKPDTDIESVKTALEKVMKGIIATAETGKITGSIQYSIIEKENRIFLICHEDQEKYSEILKYFDSIK